MKGLALVVVASLALSAAALAAPPSPTLRIVFPEGFSSRQMTDRVAAVRRIAIRVRHVKPVLTGAAYRSAAARTAPPGGFGAKSVEGFLFPSVYTFGPSTTAPQLIGLQLAAFARAWKTVDLRAAEARGRTPYDVLVVASMAERETVAPAERPLVAAVIY